MLYITCYVNFPYNIIKFKTVLTFDFIVILVYVQNQHKSQYNCILLFCNGARSADDEPCCLDELDRQQVPVGLLTSIYPYLSSYSVPQYVLLSMCQIILVYSTVLDCIGNRSADES